MKVALRGQDGWQPLSVTVIEMDTRRENLTERIMIGYSGQECPTPFILLANVQTRLPQALVLDSIKHANIASCVRLIMRFVRSALCCFTCDRLTVCATV